MKMFSDCSGPCCLCACGAGGCLAGHGDDDYYPASKEQIIDRLNKGSYRDYRGTMIRYLKDAYGYDYEPAEHGAAILPEKRPSLDDCIQTDEEVEQLMSEIWGK